MKKLVQSPLGADIAASLSASHDTGIPVRQIDYIGTPGDDILVGDDNFNRFTGGPGNDTLIGLGGTDYYIFSGPTDGHDTIRDTGGHDVIYISAFIQNLDFHRNGMSLIIEDSLTPRKITIENFYGEGGRIESVATLVEPDVPLFQFFDLMTTNQGGARNEIFVGSSADDFFYGSGGTDTLYGAGGNDTLDGGAGQNWLYGGAGNDTYIHNGFYSTLDTISETGSGGGDTLQMAGLTLSGLHFRRSGEDLVIERYDTSTALRALETIKQVVIEDQFNIDPTYRIEMLETGDGLRWLKTGLTGTATHDILVGTTQSETISGGAGNDLFFNAGGVDRLIDQAGNDFYRLALGWGVEVSIADASGTDSLQMYHAAMEDLAFRRSGSALVIEERGTNAKVILQDHYGMGRIETIETQGGVTYAISAGLMWTNGDDLIVGDSTGNVIRGGNGDDWLIGRGGNDKLLGGDGNDILVGSAGGDELTGGAGADIFDFDNLTDSRAAAGLTDLILDFTAGTDRIDLSAIDGSGPFWGYQSLVFIGTAPFKGTNDIGEPRGEVRYFNVGGNTQIELLVTGDYTQDFSILLAGNIALSAEDFIL